jgi:hypothetical protein
MSLLISLLYIPPSSRRLVVYISSFPALLLVPVSSSDAYAAIFVVTRLQCFA